ncbi:MAG: DUF86 domain-containing protein [Bacteroidales bacterium]|jgi:uncharacterized protein with HEPN domain|nr:DUF86 domain-containing protein [Bacteroidales bacterium]
MYSKDETIVCQMLEIIDKIQGYTNPFTTPVEFFNDTKSFDATLMNFIALGEIVMKLSESFKDKHADIDWIEIYDFRNVIAHDYFGIDEEEVFQIIQNHVPQLKTALLRIIP